MYGQCTSEDCGFVGAWLPPRKYSTYGLGDCTADWLTDWPVARADPPQDCWRVFADLHWVSATSVAAPAGATDMDF